MIYLCSVTYTGNAIFKLILNIKYLKSISTNKDPKHQSNHFSEVQSSISNPLNMFMTI